MKEKKLRWGLQQRLIASVMLVFCMPMLLIGSYILIEMNQKLFDNALVSANAMLDAVEQEITHTLLGAQDTASLLAADTEFYAFFSRPQADAAIVNLYTKKISPMIVQAHLQFPALRSLRLLHHNDSLFAIRDVLVNLGDISEVTALMRDEGSRLAIKSIQYSRTGRSWAVSGEESIWYIDAVIPPTSYNNPAAVMEIVLDQAALWTSATRMVQETGLHILLLQKDTLISATQDTFFSQARAASGEGVFHLRGCTLIRREIASLKMSLCCAIPSPMTSIAPGYLLLVFLALAVIVGFTWLLVRLICQKQLRSLNALTARIDAISPDGTGPNQQEPEDEVERLSQHFDSMYQRLGESFGREKQLLYDDLTNQLKPHFICNAMDMLRLQAEHFQQDQLAESIVQINQYFRYSMLDSGASVTLGEETDNALNYLRLVNVMREDKIHFDLTMDDWSEAHANTARIPKMLLQPLLENAVRHGVKSKKNAYIGIQIAYSSGCLEIRVADNGAGMEPEVLAQWNQFLQGDNDMKNVHHVGLMNVIRRLKLLYPNAHTVFIDSKPYMGTTVTLKLWLEGQV